MEDILVPIVALVCVFGTPVAIVYMILNHRKNQAAALPSAAASTELVNMAHKMEQRIDALEQILDAEAPGWRKRHHE